MLSFEMEIYCLLGGTDLISIYITYISGLHVLTMGRALFMKCHCEQNQSEVQTDVLGWNEIKGKLNLKIWKNYLNLKTWKNYLNLKTWKNNLNLRIWKK